VDDTWAAASTGDLDEMERLAGQDPGLVNAKEVHGFTPLMLASLKGQVEVVRWLIDRGAVINELNSISQSALYISCFEGHTSLVRFLVERGATPASSMRGVGPP
jgi:ankyrin repeat protein